jgi:hypothetical protein
MLESLEGALIRELLEGGPRTKVAPVGRRRPVDKEAAYANTHDADSTLYTATGSNVLWS